MAAITLELRFSLINGLKTNDRGPKFSLVEPFRFNFCVYSVGRTFIYLTTTVFKSCIAKHLVNARRALLPILLPDYVHRMN